MKVVKIILMFSIISILGCKSSSVSKTPEYLQAEKSTMLTDLYIKTFLDARYANVGQMLLSGQGGAIGIAISHSISDNAARSKMYEAKSEYEKEKLGEFDVFLAFQEQFFLLKDSIKGLNIKLVDKMDNHNKIIKYIVAKEKGIDTLFVSEVKKTGSKYLSALKFQYGLAMRQGNEQMGFDKTYRPFVRILGSIKNVYNNNIVWKNEITIFSQDVAYKGVTAAKNANGSELKDAYIVLCKQLAKVVVDDMNGKKFKQKEVLIGLVNSDRNY